MSQLGFEKQRPLANLSDRMEFVSKKALPDSLAQLANRQESFDHVVKYLEGNYIAAQRSGSDKEAVQKEAQAYITKAMVNIFKDIDFAASSVDQLVSMQELSVNSLVNQIDMVQMRLHSLKGQHLLTTLDEMKAPTGALTSSAAPPAVKDISLPQDVWLVHAQREQQLQLQQAHGAAAAIGSGPESADELTVTDLSTLAGDETLDGSQPSGKPATPSSITNGPPALPKKSRAAINQRLLKIQSIGAVTTDK